MMRITEESVNQYEETREAAIQSETNPEVAIVEHIAQECGSQLACKYAELNGYPSAFVKKLSDQHQSEKQNVNRSCGISRSRKNLVKHRMRDALIALCVIVLILMLVLCIEANGLPFQVIIDCAVLCPFITMTLSMKRLSDAIDLSKETVNNKANASVMLFIFAFLMAVTILCGYIILDIQQLSDIEKIGRVGWFILIDYMALALIWSSRKMFKEAKIIEEELTCGNKKDE